MDYKQAIDAITTLEGRLVALVTTITRPAPGVDPDHLENTTAGVLTSGDVPPSTDRPIDEAAWWHEREAKTVVRIEPDHSLFLARERFRTAKWDGETLEVETRAIRYRFVPFNPSNREPLRDAEGLASHTSLPQPSS